MDRMDYGIFLTRESETLKLFFTDEQQWDPFCAWNFCVTAVDESGREYSLSYAPPRLDPDEGEADVDYYDRCAEACDWAHPWFVARLDDGETWDIEDDPACTVEWFD